MRVAYEDISNKKGNKAFACYQMSLPKFEFKWHYHPEYELTLVIKGNGRRLVGDSYENFVSGDLVLIGPGLPHTWVTNVTTTGKKTAVVIQFPESLLKSLIEYEEFADIKSLLQYADQGLFFPKINKQLVEEITSLPDKTGLERVSSFIALLNGLSRCRNKRLASKHYQPLKGKVNESRINIVCSFIQEHSSESCTIKKAASLIHLSDSAFCKFFKRMTGKTFSDYLNDVRIANACILLQQTDKTIAAISFEAGFESLTYFNRVFKRKRGANPNTYRKGN